MRRVIVHYHIFKNAGSSVDTILGEAFGSQWANFDPVEKFTDHVMPTEALAEFIERNPDLMAVSSHIARPPLPDIPGVQIYPIVFLRDPMIRVASFYKFLLRTEASTTRDLPMFVRERFRDFGGAGIADFQTTVLAGTQARRRRFPFQRKYPKPTEKTLTRAQAFMRQLPVVGIVEHFEYSAQRFADWLQPLFPQLHWRTLRENRGGPGLTSHYEICTALGPSLYAELLAENQFDLRLYEEAMRLHGLRGNGGHLEAFRSLARLAHAGMIANQVAT